MGSGCVPYGGFERAACMRAIPPRRVVRDGAKRPATFIVRFHRGTRYRTRLELARSRESHASTRARPRLLIDKPANLVCADKPGQSDKTARCVHAPCFPRNPARTSLSRISPDTIERTNPAIYLPRQIPRWIIKPKSKAISRRQPHQPRVNYKVNRRVPG